ncbi:MAG: hypothetical protein JSU61_11150 [Fidelibacterota bacterium]|nr:MAG: hypothetical protein JSU61_11150 [Candidatus Neomarinimicrobiota bacterium]
MFKLEYHILINESPKVVWAFVANMPVSMTCHRLRRRFQWINGAKPEEGARYIVELELLGLSFRQEGRVVIWEPPHQLAMAQWAPRHPRRGYSYQRRLSVHPVEGRPQAAILRLAILGSLRPWLVERILKQFVRRGMLDHLEVLKRAIESTDKYGRAQMKSARRLAEVPAVGAG